MAFADSSSVSVNDHDSRSLTEKPTENLDTAGESPQASESKACGFNTAHRRLRCNGHVINLAVQAFLFGKNKDASDEALRQVSQLSYDEQEGSVERAETATTWRQYGALGMLHNLVNSWYLMIHIAITLRKEINSFIDDHYMEGDIKLDYLHPEHWQELQEVHNFLQPFYEITKDTQWDKSSLDEVICSMDFLITHYKAAMQQFQHDITMADRIITSWYKFDDYYKRTDDSPVYAAAILLHPSLLRAHLDEAWKDQSHYIAPAIDAVRKLWEGFKPVQVLEMEEDLSAYEAYKKRIYQQSSSHDEFDRFMEGPPLPIDFPTPRMADNNPEFNDPKSRAPFIIGLTVGLTSLSTILTSLRLYTRTAILHTAGLDDVAVAVAQSLFAAIQTYIWGLCIIKVAFLLQYRRIFNVMWIRKVALGVIAFSVTWNILQAILCSLTCVPIALFAPSRQHRCINSLPVWLTAAVVNIITDFIVFVLPLPAIKSLPLPTKQKILLSGVVCLGFFTCIVSIVRVPALHLVMKSPDTSWIGQGAAVWSVVEINCAISCACLPMLKPLISRLLPGLLTHRRMSTNERWESRSVGSYALRLQPKMSNRAGSTEALNPLERVVYGNTREISISGCQGEVGLGTEEESDAHMTEYPQIHVRTEMVIKEEIQLRPDDARG
ncbi:hypothetical protein FoTM2_017233 [Fusarium oxysporum f. sp. vasinfectum]|nr:hypothetical protein FoTM2_017233 [Fusarium oxysporum f. sp. vasinfectum]